MKNLVYKAGSGAPEGSVQARIGAVYFDTASGRLYVKESGADATGWAAR